MNAIADKLHLLETVAPNDALLASMLEMVLLHGFITKGMNDRCSLLEGDRHG
jgi:hypothetical protein